MQLLGGIRNILSQIKSQKRDTKIVVIESDDWGTIRMQSHSHWKDLKSKNIDVTSNPFNHFDTVEKDSDIEELMEMFEQIKKETGKTVKFTMNFVMANPNFEKIESDQFTTYSYLPIEYTYQEYSDSGNVLTLVNKGRSDGYFQPQFHCREHVNVDLWMKLLCEKNLHFRQAFDAKTFAISAKGIPNVWEAYSYSSAYQESSIPDAIQTGIQLFQSTFGFSSKTTIAPVGVWDDFVEETFRDNSLFCFQGFLVQKLNPYKNNDKRYHYNGQKNAYGSTYLVRNAYFEPATSSIDWVGNCLRQVKQAFLFRNPAIISTHRINYVSRISSENKDQGIKQLKILLLSIIREWPEVEFFFTDELI